MKVPQVASTDPHDAEEARQQDRARDLGKAKGDGKDEMGNIYIYIFNGKLNGD